MDAMDFRSYLIARRFRAFRIFVSDGTYWDVKHPELAILGFSTVTVSYPSSDIPDELNDFDVMISLFQITRLEFIPR